MRKIGFVLAGLALSACTTGGDFSSGGASDGLTPGQRAAIASNKHVTGMLTYLETDSNGNTVVGRGATTRSVAGTYNLEDVHFAIADEGFDTDGFKFVTNDDGKIIGIDMGFSEDDGYPGYEGDPGYLVRGDADDSIEFTGLVNDDSSNDNNDNNDNNGGGRSSNWKPATYTYVSLGKADQVGLRYSDFGYINIDTEGREFWRPAFIAGYDNGKKIAEADITGITGGDEFTGRVVGHVMSIKNGEGSGQALPLDTTATLKFDGSESTMNANFENWYKVKYTENGDQKIMYFSDYNNHDDSTGVFRLISDDGSGDFKLDNSVTWQDDDEEVSRLNSDIRYFGENGTPTEAVGLIQLRDCNGAECTSDYEETPEVRMNIGFGVKR